MRHCVTDKHLERLKVRVTNYRIGGVGPSNEDQGEGKGQKVEKQQNFFSIFKKAKTSYWIRQLRYRSIYGQAEKQK